MTYDSKVLAAEHEQFRRRPQRKSRRTQRVVGEPSTNRASSAAYRCCRCPTEDEPMLRCGASARVAARSARRLEAPRRAAPDGTASARPHRHALDRRVEIPERLLRDRRGDLGAEARREIVLMNDHAVSRLLDRREHAPAVPRRDGPQVDQLDVVAETRPPPRRSDARARPTSRA